MFRLVYVFSQLSSYVNIVYVYLYKLENTYLGKI